LPKNIGNLVKLTSIDLSGNPLKDLSILQSLPNLKAVNFLDIEIPRRYWIKFTDWKAEWLLDEDNAEIRRILIEQVGYEKICEELNAIDLDTWREYTLLKIDGVEAVYDEDKDNDEPIDREPMVLLKMTCPSTQHIHILRVPPEMESAEAAITWVNHGIHPDEFAVQT
jgi:leucine-rich repeat protein SHOC2